MEYQDNEGHIVRPCFRKKNKKQKKKKFKWEENQENVYYFKKGMDRETRKR